jgi:rod shape-determining protein MreC
MPKKVNSLPYFLVFFILSILLIFLGTTGLISAVTGEINKAAAPIRNATYNLLTLPAFRNKTITLLTAENQELYSRLAQNQNLINEDKALRDQFAVSGNNSLKLLPARVVGFPGLIPGEVEPSYLIIDQGTDDGVVVGSAVVVKNNLIGKVISTEKGFSRVELVSSRKSSFTAKTGLDNLISAVAKGQGDSILLDNVTLSENLRKGDLVTTKGEVSEKGVGFPPDLVVGRIISVEKKPSDLFQKAKVQSLVNFQNLSSVFVMK